MQQKEEVFIKNQWSDAAHQPTQKNWGSFFQKKPGERLTLMALKSTCKNKGRLNVLGNKLSDLGGIKVIISPFDKGAKI